MEVWRAGRARTGPLRPSDRTTPFMTQQIDSVPLLQRAQDVLDSGALRAHYQPIVQLKDGKVVAHESLIRLPGHSALRTPDDFFKAEIGRASCRERV